jgi:hypothetical protein
LGLSKFITIRNDVVILDWRWQGHGGCSGGRECGCAAGDGVVSCADAIIIVCEAEKSNTSALIFFQKGDCKLNILSQKFSEQSAEIAGFQAWN